MTQAKSIEQTVNIENQNVVPCTSVLDATTKYLNECKRLAEPRKYHISGVYAGSTEDAVLTGINIHDRKYFRFFSTLSLNNLLEELPREYKVVDGNESKTYSVQIKVKLSSVFLGG